MVYLLCTLYSLHIAVEYNRMPLKPNSQHIFRNILCITLLSDRNYYAKHIDTPNRDALSFIQSRSTLCTKFVHKFNNIEMIKFGNFMEDLWTWPYEHIYRYVLQNCIVFITTLSIQLSLSWHSNMGTFVTFRNDIKWHRALNVSTQLWNTFIIMMSGCDLLYT